MTLDRALNMGKDSATGSSHLFIAKIASTIILAVSTIFIGILISDVEYGLYVKALIPVTTILLFQDWGVGAALTKYSASFRALKEEENLRKIIISGLTFEIITGIALTLLLLFLSGFFSATILDQPDSEFLIAIGSITILFAGLSAVCQAIFVGFERMRLTGLTMVCQGIVYCSISPILVYFGYGAIGIMLGYTISYVATGIISAIFLYFFIFNKLRPCSLSRSELSSNLKTLLGYGIPLAIGLLLSGLLAQFYSFMMAYFCDVAIIGHYKIALNFAVFITFFTVPISTVLFPAFSKLESANDNEVLKSVFISSIKYTALFSVPATIAMIVLANPLISTLYGDKWFYSPLFLGLGLIQYLFISMGSVTNSTFLQGVGETKMLMKLRVIGLLAGIPLAFLLIPRFEIIGLIFSTLIAALPSLFIGIYWIWKHYRIRFDLSSSLKIIIASSIAGLATYLFLNIFVAAAWMVLTIGALLFLSIYLLCAPLIGAITQSDINNLRVMFSGLGLMSKIFGIILSIVEKPLKINAKRIRIKKRK